jgi:hypothetical protein
MTYERPQSAFDPDWTPRPEHGANLLDDVRRALTRYVVLPSNEAATAVVLWIVATHAVSVFEHATRLAIHSPVKRCGKSRLLEVIEALSHHPIATTNISVAALFRMIDAAGDHPPTLILDEADRLFGNEKKDEDNRDLINLLNNGFRPGRPTYRCVGPQQVATPFSNFAFAAVAGIGRKPDTIEDRAVNITMRRRLPDETVTKFRLRTDLPAMHALRDRIATWASAHLAELEKPVDDMPDELEDRAQDAWEPLFSVAAAAGDDWLKAARKAAVALTAEGDEDGDQSLDVRLLADIRDVFAAMPNVTFLPTKILLHELGKIEDAPWGEFEFTGRRLALRLGEKTFRIKPRRNSAGTERGYHLSDFKDAFRRYLPSEPSEPSDTGAEQQERSDTSEASDTSQPSDGPKRQDDNRRSDPLFDASDGSDGSPASELGRALRAQPIDPRRSA